MFNNNAPTVIRAEHLFLALEFLDRAGSHRFLQGVHVDAAESGGAAIVATEGVRMGIFRDETAMVGRTATWRIPNDVARAIRPRSSQLKGFSWAVLQEGEGSEVDGFLPATVRIVEADSPAAAISAGGDPHAIFVSPPGTAYIDWRAAVRKHDAGDVAVGVDGGRLRPFVSAGASRRHAKASAPLSIRPSRDGSGPTVIRTDRTDFLGLIAPVGGMDAGPAIPDWFGKT